MRMIAVAVLLGCVWIGCGLAALATKDADIMGAAVGITICAVVFGGFDE